MRDLAPEVKEITQAQSIHTAHLFRAVFTNRETGQDEIFYATDNFQNVEHDGITYPALGHFLGYEGAEENAEMAIGTAQVSLSGVEAAYISAVLSFIYINRDLTVSRVFFDQDARLVGDPEPVLSGPMDEPVINDDPDAGTSTVTLSVSNHFAAFDRRPGRHTNHQEQQAFFPGDQFFSSFGNLDQDITWGRA